MRRPCAWLVIALALGLGGCLLAEPRPDPAQDAAVKSDSSIGTGSDAGSSPTDAGAGSALEVNPANVAISGGDSAAGDLAVVGLMDALLAGVGIQITNTTAGGMPVVVAATPTGTFAAIVQGAASDVLELVVIADGVAGTQFGGPVQVTASDAADSLAPAAVGDPTPGNGMVDFDGALVTITADGLGNVTVTGNAMATAAAAEVVAGNTTNGATATATAAADGSFMLVLAGASGDTIVLFARSGALSSATQVQVVP